MEDGSGMCWTSGTLGMSDHGPSKKHRKSGYVLRAVGSGKSQETLWEDGVSRCVQGTETRAQKKDVTNSGSQAGVKSGINKTNTSEASFSVFFLCLSLALSSCVVVCCVLCVVCCVLFVVCCLLFVVMLFVVCCLLFVVCCLLFVVCCLLFVVCCLLFVVCCLLFVVCCLLFVVVCVRCVWCETLKNASVCTFKTPPCAPAPRPQLKHMGAWCRQTRGMF